MIDKTIPKILVIGNRINLRSGAGITFYNLFKNWPREKLIVAATAIDDRGVELCEKYYRIGYLETTRPWPLNKFQPYYASEEVILKNEILAHQDMSDYKIKKSKYNPIIKSILTRFLHFSGLYYFLFPLRVSESIIKWIKKEDPGIIYTQLGLPELILFTNELIRIIDKPLIIHIMDDWIQLVPKGGFAHLYWNRKINSTYIKLLNHSKCLMSICKIMSDEYKERYSLEFIPFQNCIDIDFWSRHQKKSWKIADKFQILYAGRMGTGTSSSVIKVAQAIEELGKEGINIELQIQAPNIHEKYLKKIKPLKYVKFNSFLPYEKIPEKFSSVDLLLLPMDFDKKNLKYIRLSMPTKVPEYMSTGTPILVFAPENTALSKYALSEGWAKVCCKDSIKELKRTIKELITNEEMRFQLAQQAMRTVKNNHRNEIVRDQFYHLLMKAGSTLSCSRGCSKKLILK